MFQGLTAQRLLALFGAGWALLSFPLITLWAPEAMLLGLPLLPLAVFGLWAGLIAALALLVERAGED